VAWQRIKLQSVVSACDGCMAWDAAAAAAAAAWVDMLTTTDQGRTVHEHRATHTQR